MVNVNLEDEFTQEVFEYLDELRLSGVTNMFGAGSFIEQDFGLSRNEARAFLSEWMNTFRERHPTD